MRCLELKPHKLTLRDIPLHTLVEFNGITGIVVMYDGKKAVSFNEKAPLPIHKDVRFEIKRNQWSVNDEHANRNKQTRL